MWGIGELGNWGVGELGNWGIGDQKGRGKTRPLPIHYIFFLTQSTNLLIYQSTKALTGYSSRSETPHSFGFVRV